MKKQVSSVVVKKAKKKGIAKKHPNKNESNKPYKAQGR